MNKDFFFSLLQCYLHQYLLHRNKINCIVSDAQSKRNQCLKIATLRDVVKNGNISSMFLVELSMLRRFVIATSDLKIMVFCPKRKVLFVRRNNQSAGQVHYTDGQTFANRRMTLQQLRQDLSQNSQGAVLVNVNTISRRLKSEGMISYVPVKKNNYSNKLKNQNSSNGPRGIGIGPLKIGKWSSFQMNPCSEPIPIDDADGRRCRWYGVRNRCEKSPLGVMVWGATSSKWVSQLKLVNGTMNS